MATGFTPTPDGPGCRTSPSAGPLITTVAGLAYAMSDGSGFRARNGHRHGFRGAKAMITWGGRHCLLKPVSITAPVFVIGLTIITTSGRLNIVLFEPRSSERRASNRPLFRSNRTLPLSTERQ